MKSKVLIIVFVVVALATIVYIAGMFSAPGRSTATPVTTTRTLASSNTSIRVTDILGRSVALKASIDKIAIISEHPEYYIVAVDAVAGTDGLEKIRAVSLDAWRSSTPRLYHLYTDAVPALSDVVDVGAPRKGVKVELLIRIHPDVVITGPDDYKVLVEKGVANLLAEKGIPIVVLDFTPNATLDKILKSIEILGIVLGNPDRVEKLLAWYKDRLHEIRAKLSDIDYKPVVCIKAGKSEESSWAILAGYVKTEIVECTGGLSAKPAAVLVASSDIGPGVDEDSASRLLIKLAEMYPSRNGVCIVYPVLRGSVWSIIGLEVLAKTGHPGVFRDLDPVRDLKEFFKEFLSIPYTGVWFACTPPPKKRIIVVDALGRKVKVLAPADRIVVLYGLEDLVAVSGEYGLAHLVGLNKFRYVKWRPDWWKAWLDHFPWLDSLPDVGQPGYNFNPELLLRLKPDVVIVARFMYQRMAESGVLEKLEAAGIPVVVIDFVPPTTNVTEHLEAVERSILALGAVTGYEDRAENLYKFYEEQVLSVVKRVAGARYKPKVLVLATWSLWRAYGKSGMYNVWITLAGGENIAAKVIPGASGDINPEYVVRENPDVIIFTCNNNIYVGGGSRQLIVIGYTVNTTEPAKKALRMLIDRPGWDKIKAVREGRVYLIHHGLSHGHIFQFAALQWIAKWLHPERFKDVDPLANLKQFYALYMPYPLRGVWAVGINDP